MINVLIFFVSCISNNESVSSSRVNEEMVIITSPIKTIGRVIGWNRNSSGQWVSKINEIPGILFGGNDNFKNLRLFSISYRNETYIVFEKITNEERWRYPAIHQGRYILENSYIYLFENSNFVINIKRDAVVYNSIELYFGAVNPATNTNRNNIQDYLTSLFLNRWKRSDDKIFEIYTFYDTTDNVIRFYIKTGYSRYPGSDFPYNTFQTRYYFECSYKTFSDFFIANVIE